MSRGLTIRVEGVEEAVRDLAAYELRKRAALGAAVAKTLIEGEGRMRRTLSRPGLGRSYTRRGVTHQASAPGDAPAVDLGQYRASWRHRTSGLLSGELYTEQVRAPHLEFGTRRMAPRPHAGPVAEEMAADFRRNARRALGD